MYNVLYIPNDNSQNHPFWLDQLDTQINKPTNQNLIKIYKVVKNKKTLYKTWGT